MFDIGFSEILVIFVLALIVLGPEKLPRVAAQVGKILGRARAMARQFREQLEEEIKVEETRKTEAKATKPVDIPPAAAAGAAAAGAGAAGAAAGAAGAAAAGADPSATPAEAPASAVAPEPTPQGPEEIAAQGSVDTSHPAPWVAETPHDASGSVITSEPPVESESGHMDLTHEAWPYNSPAPPPDVAELFRDQLKPPAPEPAAPAAAPTVATPSPADAASSESAPPGVSKASHERAT